MLAGVVGCYVILRGMALMADSLAHGVLPGVAIAFAITASGADQGPDEAALFAGALVAGLATAAGTSLILRRSQVRQETAAGVVFVFMLALGVVIVSRVEGYSVDLTSFLFGDVLGVSGGEVAFSAILAAAVLLVVALLYRPFLLLSFDPPAGRRPRPAGTAARPRDAGPRHARRGDRLPRGGRPARARPADRAAGDRGAGDQAAAGDDGGVGRDRGRERPARACSSPGTSTWPRAARSSWSRSAPSCWP